MKALSDLGVRVAAPDELPAIGRFRYAALAPDPGFRPTEEMLASQQLVDAWDPISQVLVIGAVGDIQGTFRVVPLSRVVAQEGLNSALRTFKRLGLERALDAFPIHAVNIVGRLAVAERSRGTQAVVHLLSAALFGCLSRGERLSLADCSPPLVRLYSKLAGFFRSGPNYYDPIYGEKTPLMGALCDHQALAMAAIGHVASAWSDDEGARAFRLEVESAASSQRVA